jgi:hypothetical protein
LKVGTQARAETRVLISAALIGSGVGMALGAAYLAGGMAQAATDYSRAARIAQAADGAYSEAVLQSRAADPTVVRLARTHDPLVTNAGSDRRLASFAAMLDQPGSRLDGSTRNRAPSSASELDCLTQAVYFEARGETSRGQAAVAQVVMNRVNHPAFPKTVCGVVYQGAARATGCQFSFACDGSMRRGREAAAWTRARQVAARALSGAVLPEIGAATHFHTTQVSPDWGPRMRRVAQVGLHVFYRFGPREAAPATSGPGEVMLASLKATPAHPVPAELRIATALVGKAIDAVDGVDEPELAVPADPVAVTAAPAPEAPVAAKAPVRAPELPPQAPGKSAEASHPRADVAVS